MAPAGPTGAIFRYDMTVAKPIASLAVLGVLLSAPALAASATSRASSAATVTISVPKAAVTARSQAENAAAPSTTTGEASAPKTVATPPHAILQSPQLWATVDVCNPSDQPDTVGIRGSMPGDGHAKDAMYMRFRLQYLESSTKHWIDLAHGADSGFVAVGAAKSARQTGRSFQLVPVAGKPAVDLRGVVSFQWRRGSTVEYAISRPTTAEHKSLAGADPAGFSAADCSFS
jgi:hypothetical protein